MTRDKRRGLFVLGGQNSSNRPEDWADLAPADAAAEALCAHCGHVNYIHDGPCVCGECEGFAPLPAGDQPPLGNPAAVAAAIEWDQTVAAEPYQVDVTRSLDDTTRMGNSLSAAVRLELLADDMRAKVRDDRSAAERTADQLAAAELIDPVDGAELDPVDGLPYGPDGDDVWEHTAELPVVPLTVADLTAELSPRIYAAPPPKRPAQLEPFASEEERREWAGAVPMSAEQSRSTGGTSARILNWVSRHDDRSLAYGIRPRLAGPAPLVDRDWPHGPILDQGTAPPLSLHDASGCTGHAAVNAANILDLASNPPGAMPLDGADLYGHGDAMRAYERAQELDEVPGKAYPGTSVLAVMKAGQEFGWWGAYRWAFGTRDVAQALLQVGPVLVGIPWLSKMTDTGPDGIVTVGGDDLGGHCLCLFAIRMTLAGRAGPWFGALQTWGESVGDRGVIWFHHRDMANLLHSVGEAAVPMATQ